MLKRLKNNLIYLLARMMIGLVRGLSLPWALGFGRFLGRLCFRVARGPRRDALYNLALVFPEMPVFERLELVRRVFEHFGMAAAEWANIHRLDLQSYAQLTPESGKVLDEVLSRGQGAVFIAGHLGNWELMAVALSRLGYPINTIGKRSYDPRFTRWIEQTRLLGPAHTLWRGDPDLVERMVAVIRARQIMGFLIDQDTKVPGTFVPFFGQEAFTPTAAAVLARKTGAPVVIGFIHRRPEGGYEIQIEEQAASTNPDFQAAVNEDTALHTSAIERHIREHPAEWVWMHRRFKTRPGDQGTPGDKEGGN
jgi:KDO2-lipid IV(A) lauroyltransferase